MLIGDLSQIGALEERLADLAQVPARAALKVAERIHYEMQAEFDQGVDPYGNPWDQLADSTVDRGRHAPPLTDTHAMRDSLSVLPMRAAGVAITIDHPALPHQTGWEGPISDGPARPILPQGSWLPEAWQDIIDEEVEREFKRSA